jgi:ribosome-binding factor A
MSIKNERINSNIQKELSYILANEIKNPSVKFITITACDVTSDISYARVYFTSFNDPKETLNGLCADLFRFCDQCAKGNVSLRKLKAISQCKVDIIKLLLECDYALTKNNNIKKAIDFIKQLKLENN